MTLQSFLFLSWGLGVSYFWALHLSSYSPKGLNKFLIALLVVCWPATLAVVLVASVLWLASRALQLTLGSLPQLLSSLEKV